MDTDMEPSSSSSSKLEKSVSELIKRSYTRAIQPKKWARLIRELVKSDIGHENNEDFDNLPNLAQHIIAESLLVQLARSVSPPSLLLSYLAQSLVADLFSASTLVLHLLFLMSEPEANISSQDEFGLTSGSGDEIGTGAAGSSTISGLGSAGLSSNQFHGRTTTDGMEYTAGSMKKAAQMLEVSQTAMKRTSIEFISIVSTIIMSHPTKLGPTDIFEPIIEIPSSNSGVSRSAPALTLLLPLIRLCVLTPAASSSTTVSSPSIAVLTPIVALASRLASLLPANPPPPFDVGLEVAQLCSDLPEELARPLRDSLAGLNADLPLPDAGPTHLPTHMMAVDNASLTNGGPAPGSNAATMAKTSGGGFSGGSIKTVAGPLPLSITHSIRLLLEYSHRALTWVSNSSYQARPPVPPPNQMNIIKLGHILINNPATFLATLLEVSMKPLEMWTVGSVGAVRVWCFFVEEIPILLRWWREVEDSKFPFPTDLREILEARLTESAVQLEQLSSGLMDFYTASFAQSEPNEDAGNYSEPEGWTILSVRETIVRQYLEYGLLEEEALTHLVPNANRQAPSINGESLMNRLATSSKSHIPSLEFFILQAYGATRAFASEVVQALETNNIPENLLENLSASPILINVLATYITPSDLLALVEDKLLNRPDDPTARANDPQGNLIRFGAGVMFAEALCAQHQLPLPDLLDDTRRVKRLSDLNEDQKSLMNGWVKALFGSDGIDDQILMLSSAQGFYSCVVTLIQQSIIAASCDLIDLETLRSGLSYFSQPLLSWTLGGVVAWLCSEIERQGPMAGLHLEVLQTLVLDSSFPQALLIVNEKAINHVLDPLTGLGAVLQSSGFDVDAVQTKVTTQKTTTMRDLRAELANLRHIDLAPSTWPVSLLEATTTNTRSLGSAGVINAMLSELIRPPPIEIGSESQNTTSTNTEFASLVSILCALSLDRQDPDQSHSPAALPLLHPLIDAYIPSLFNPNSPFGQSNVNLNQSSNTNSIQFSNNPSGISLSPQAPQLIYNVLRYALLLMSETGESDLSDILASHLAEELLYQLGREGGKESKSSDEGKRDERGGRSDWENVDINGKEAKERMMKKDRKQGAIKSGDGHDMMSEKGNKEEGDGDKPLSLAQSSLLNSLVGALEEDGEIKTRWPMLSKLR